MPSLRMVALAASARTQSASRQLIELACGLARGAGIEADALVLADLPLPLLIPGPDEPIPPVVRELRERLEGAELLLIVTPVYHDSYSGLLKVALDLIPSELLQGRLAALVSVGGGRLGNGQALEHLRAVLREMGIWVLPQQVIVNSSGSAFSAEGTLRDAELKGRVDRLVEELIARGRALVGNLRP